MIHRIQLLRSIGQFDSVQAAANLPLARLTLVYSENGRGKTTLAAVLRSLASGDPLPIAERRRLAAVQAPHIVIDAGDGQPAIVFQNNVWSRTVPELVIFDDTFIDENVHSGLAVDAHHRQNLHELILGATAVGLNRQLQMLVESIETHNSALRTIAGNVSATSRGPFTIDEFCALTPRDDVAEAVQAAERNLAGAREQEAIRGAAAFDLITMPGIELGPVSEILRLDLPALEAGAVARIQQHLTGLGAGGEAWVAEGMRRAAGVGDVPTGTCPFCGQDLTGSTILEHYRAYFSNDYAALKRAAADAIAQLRRAHGGEVQAGFERAVRVAIERRQFWSRFCEIAEFALDTAAIVRDWSAARDAVLSQLAAKQAAPLEPIDISAATQALAATYNSHCDAIARFNRELEVANQEVALAQERALTANPAVRAEDLARLKAVEARWTPAIAPICDQYVQERAAKDATERQRDQTRVALERHRANVFPGYQTAINGYLSTLNAGFRLDSVNYANTRGGPTCTYNVLINNTPVPVGRGDPAPGEPSFRNTLSAGDRNTLALAFFFASLDQDQTLANKIVVVDDPISSLDEHRSLATVAELRRLSQRTSQAIVLSHDKSFLCRLWKSADHANAAALEIVREAAGSTFRAWDVNHDSITEHDKRHQKMLAYLDTGHGDLREVAVSIRPHLEAFLRVASPREFPPGTLIGPFIGICDQRAAVGSPVLCQASVQELREVLEYGNRFHHDTNPAWETENINDGELRGFVERTLRFAGKP